MSHDGFDWANLTFSGVASLGTAGAFLWTVSLYRGELRRRRKADQAAERAQANLVTSWVWYPPSRGGLPGTGTLIVRNGSDMPVFDVVLCLIRRDGQLLNYDVGLLAPTETFVDENHEHSRYAGGSKAVAQAFWFVDAAGERWFRDWAGELRTYPSAYGDEPEPDWWAPLLEKWRSWWTDAPPGGWPNDV